MWAVQHFPSKGWQQICDIIQKKIKGGIRVAVKSKPFWLFSYGNKICYLRQNISIIDGRGATSGHRPSSIYVPSFIIIFMKIVNMDQSLTVVKDTNNCRPLGLYRELIEYIGMQMCRKMIKQNRSHEKWRSCVFFLHSFITVLSKQGKANRKVWARCWVKPQCSIDIEIWIPIILCTFNFHKSRHQR